MMEGGQPRHRTARELLAMAEAVRLAEAERVGRPARVRIPTAVAIRVPLAGAVARDGGPESGDPRCGAGDRGAGGASRGRGPHPRRHRARRPTRLEDQPVHAVGRPGSAVGRSRTARSDGDARGGCDRACRVRRACARAGGTGGRPGLGRAPSSSRSGPEGVAPANEPDAVAPAEPVTLEIEEIHREFVTAAAELNHPLAPQHDLFEAMGEPADRFETPTEAPTRNSRGWQGAQTGSTGPTT